MNKYLRNWAWVLAVLPLFTLAQQGTDPHINSILTGQVLDGKTKTPLQGVVLQIKGTTHEVLTDDKGKFTFKTGQQFPYILIVTYIGYQNLEFTATGSPVNIELKEAQNQLNEVVVVGYGTQRKSDVTGSVATVPRGNLSQPVSSPENLLEGAVAGVVVTQSSGQPGATSSVRIRGGNSITGGNEPLYVIDGFPIYNDNSTGNTGLTYSGAQLNVLSTINPGDIESISVLKDASATAIYGTRGANGVVIITTKKGTKGSDNVSYQGYAGTQQAGKTLSLLNGGQWAQLQNDLRASQSLQPLFTQSQIDSIGKGADWQAAALRKAFTQSHQVTVAGGDEKSRYYVSGNYLSQDGIIINTNFTRIGANFGYEKTISSKFRVGINAIASHSVLNGLGGLGGAGTNFATNGLTQSLYNSPVVPVKNADGTYNLNNPYIGQTNGISPNPIADLASVQNATNINRTLGNFFGEYKITPDLAFKVSLNGDIIDTRQNYYAPSYSTIGVSTKGYGSSGSEQVISWLNENTLTYDHAFANKHFLNVLAGYTTYDSRGLQSVASATNFINDATGYNSLQSGTAALPSSNAYESVLNSFLGRVNYSFQHRYNLTASLRADGSSRFAKGHQWGYFPAVGFSWNITEENFAKGIARVANTLKLRLSAGTTGNQEIGNYQYLANLAPNNYSFAGVLNTGLYSLGLANPNLTWETTAQYDGGVDASFLNNRVTVTFDAYYKKTTNLLLSVSVPQTTGHSTELENIGSVENKGVEIGITTDNLKSKAVSWKTTLVFAANSNKVLSLGGSQSIVPAFANPVLQIQVPLILQVGQPLGTFYGYRTNGIVQTGDKLTDVPKPSWVSAAVQPGDRKYVDQNGDGVINGSDKVRLGNSQPKFTGGFTNTFTYKNFDLLVFLQGSYGGKIFNALRQQLEITTYATNSTADIANRWTTTNPSNDVPRATVSPTAVVSDRFIEDASYLRIKTLSLGYTLPNAIASKLLLKKLRVYVAAQNLVTWTKYSGYDPEVNSFEQSNLNTGVDYGAYPTAKTYLVGLSVTF